METNIKKQDLRIGNYLRCSRYLNHQEALDDLEEDYTYDEEWLTDTVVGICHPHEDFMYWSGLDEEELMNRVDGIPLTEEWLKIFGFKPNSFSYNWENGTRLSLYEKDGYDYFIAQIDNVVIKQVETVNELQNLYYSFTGLELREVEEKIKEKVW